MPAWRRNGRRSGRLSGTRCDTATVSEPYHQDCPIDPHPTQCPSTQHNHQVCHPNPKPEKGFVGETTTIKSAVFVCGPLWTPPPLTLPKRIPLLFLVWAEEEGGEGGGGEGGTGAGVRGLADQAQEGHPPGLRGRRRRGRREHPGHRPQVPARPPAGHV